EQRKGEAVLVVEGLDLLHRIGRDAQDDRPSAVVVGVVVTHPARLSRTPRRVRLGIEVEHHDLPAQARQGEGLATLIWEREVRSEVAGVGGHGAYFSSLDRRRSFITRPPVWHAGQ